jgi:hypothetical protein
LTLRDVWSTWWPLAASWLMMGFELPAVSATMARMPSPEISLAAYGGVVFPLALVVEAPIIMLLSASTALSRDRATYRKLRRFMLRAGGGLTLIHVAIAATPLFDVVVGGLLGAPEEIRPAARLGLLILTPWTWSIAYRRFQQGLLIRSGRSRTVGVGTVVRLGSNVSVLVVGYLLGRAPGIVVGTAAVSAGVMAEALFVGIAVRPILRDELPDEIAGDPPLTLRRFLDFYAPLALTSTLALIALPMGSAAMGRLPRPIESLAVWPVINGLTFTLRSLGFAYNEVVVALLDREGAYPALRRFTRLLASSTSTVLLVVAASPLSSLWFAGVSGLAPRLAELGGRALWITLPMPALSVAQSWFQGTLTQARRTRAIGEAIVLFLVTTAAVLLTGMRIGRIPGIYVGLAATVSGYLAQSAWLGWRSRHVRAAHAGGVRTVPGIAPEQPV